MQIISKNEDERSSSGRTNSVGTIIYIRRVGGYLEREHIGELEGRYTRI